MCKEEEEPACWLDDDALVAGTRNRLKPVQSLSNTTWFGGSGASKAPEQGFLAL